MYIIEDWMSQHVYKDKTFDSFEDARGFISEVATQAADNEIGYHRMGNDDWEDVYNGICEDLYAIEVEENSND